MAWSKLPTDYTDATWDGLRKYTLLNNDDDTVSFRDVTNYANREKSFFGAKDANQMNGAINSLMTLEGIPESEAQSNHKILLYGDELYQATLKELAAGFNAEDLTYAIDTSGNKISIKDKIDAVEANSKKMILMEQITVKGIGESYFYVGDKTGYVLMGVYNYAREYNTADVVRISHNVAQKIYYVFVEQVQPTTSSMALRLFWLAT